LDVWLIILIAYTLIYEPIIGYFGYKKFKVQLMLQSNARVSYYKKIMVGLWIPTIIILGLIAFSELTLKDVGLTLPSFQLEILGAVPSYIIIGLIGLYSLLMVYYLLGYHFSSEFRKKFSEQKQSSMQKISYADMIPVSKEEKKCWNYVSITAGVTEEIIYRGFIIFAFSYFFPSLSIWVILLISAVLFGLAHTNQGLVEGFIRTTIIGFLFACFYVVVGSILPLILLHVVIDYVGKLGEEVN